MSNQEEKKIERQAKLNVLLGDLIDYVREGNSPLIFDLLQEIHEEVS